MKIKHNANVLVYTYVKSGYKSVQLKKNMLFYDIILIKRTG